MESENDVDLLLKIEHIKYRRTGPGKSPVGILFLYKNRVEWRDLISHDEVISLPLAKIKGYKLKGQRVSDPGKPKVQLQLCMHDDDRHTFVFMDPSLDHGGLSQQQELVKETLQQSLVRNRQLINRMEQKTTETAKEGELVRETKMNILQADDRLLDIYKHLVKQGLISAQDFWDAHLGDEFSIRSESEPIGISAGFLSGIIQPDPTAPNGLTYNLTMDTIQTIFKVFPAVERKHLELVPHDLSEEAFWTNFLRSHYIHYRDRSAESARNPLDECERFDEQEINDLIALEKGSLKRNLNLSELDEDLGIISEMRANKIPVRGHTSKLFRRFNYHSEKVLNFSLDTSVEKHLLPLESNKTLDDKMDTNASSTSYNVLNRKMSNEFALESYELASIDEEERTRLSELVPLRFQAAFKKSKENRLEDASDDSEKYKLLAQEALNKLGSVFDHNPMMAFFDGLAVNVLDDFAIHGNRDSSEFYDDDDSSIETKIFGEAGLEKAEQVHEFRLIYNRLAELLRHFWMCFPLRTLELRQKMLRLHEALESFEQKQMYDFERRHGEKAMEHCRAMLHKAQDRFAAEEELVKNQQ